MNQTVTRCPDCRVEIVEHDMDDPKGDIVRGVPGQMYDATRVDSTLRVVLCAPHVAKYARQTAIPYPTEG